MVRRRSTVRFRKGALTHRPGRWRLTCANTVGRRLRVLRLATAVTGSLRLAVPYTCPSFQPRREEQDLIAAFLADLTDWIDAASMEDSYRVGRDAAKALGEHIKDLHAANLLVGARVRYLVLTGPSADWRIAGA